MIRKMSPIMGYLLAVLIAVVGCQKQSEGPTVVSTAEPTASVDHQQYVPLSGGEAPTADTAPEVVVPYPAPSEGSDSAMTPSYPAPLPPPSSQEAYPAASTPPPAQPDVDLAALEIDLSLVTGGLTRPIGIAHAGDGSGRLFVIEKEGRIRVIQDGMLSDEPFLDISDRVGSGGSEQGLLGLAFHPRFQQNGLFFVSYTDREGNSTVSRLTAFSDHLLADPSSERFVLRQPQPAANHNGGHLAFGPDTYLYIGFGDGGGAADQYGNGQNGATWLGAMLRIDIDGSEPYGIPSDNPFIEDAATLDEIWAIGLRNPWRYAFDRLTGDLVIADVGQNQFEEVNIQQANSLGGENYGWPIMEASHCHPADTGTCDRAGLTLPVVEYDHAQGCSVTGGYVYRGERSPEMQGIYLFGDFCTGRIWGLVPGGDGGWRVAELLQRSVQVSSFGEDEQGEIYLTAMGKGELYQIVSK